MADEPRLESLDSAFNDLPLTLNVSPETQSQIDADWEHYIQYEAARRSIPPEQVRQEEELARAAIQANPLDRDKLIEAARQTPANHPYLAGDDEPSPF